MSIKYVLAIETSCDDTSVSVVQEDGFVISVISANQDQAHQPFGGIVPEIASRNHTLNILPLVDAVLKQSAQTLGCKQEVIWQHIDGIVVTARPGLIGSLLVGVLTAKTLALVHNKPFIGINHLEGHLLAPYLRDPGYQPPDHFNYPYIALAISGGHTNLYKVHELGDYEVLGSTVDDAAGEAFDKFAKMLNLGYPGGVQVDKLSQNGEPAAFKFPRAMIHEKNYDFSFSGLKTAALRQIEKMSESERAEQLENLCASYQEAIVDVLITKLARAVENEGVKTAVVTGGVSANSRVRSMAQDWADKKGVTLVIPPIRYCTDNAAMIGYAGICRLNRGETSTQDLCPMPKPLPSDFR